jgi:AcrR family transcriptional regulator
LWGGGADKKFHVTPIDINKFNVYVCDMKSNQQPSRRTYTMTARADQMARNDRNIAAAMVALWLELPIHEITLEQVAERSGVTVRTILRKYGSKEGMIEASLESDEIDFERSRKGAEPGNISEILQVLLAEYEATGHAVVRTIAAEEQYPAAHKILAKGRAYHRKWCARVFAPYLPEPGSDIYEAKLTAFITATEIYLWKLLRKDMGKSYEQTLQIFQLLIEGIIQHENISPL